MAKTQRTDEHAPSRIVPANYEYVVSYSIGQPWYTDWGRAKVIEAQDAAQEKHLPIFGGMGKCGVCGALFSHGDLWRHMSGELLHLGHECAAKYDMLSDRSEWELHHMRATKARELSNAKMRRSKSRERFLDENPGLLEALEYDHHITHSIAAQFDAKGRLSPAQVALVFKLVRDGQAKADAKARIEAERAAEKNVPAPVGRVEFRGRIVSVRARDGFRGGVEYKATIKVNTDAGSWLAWCTVPADVYREHAGAHHENAEQNLRTALVGRFVDVTATCTQSDRDEHFAFAKRPSWTLIDTTIPAPATEAEQLAMLSSDYYQAIEMLFHGIALVTGWFQGRSVRGITGGI